MSTRSRGWLPVSSVNAVAVGVLLAGGAVTALSGRWSEGFLLIAAGLIGLAGAVYARRAGASDLARVNAIEYRDERDKQIAQLGLAAVGAVALVLSVLSVLLVVVFGDEHEWLATASPFLAGQLLVLCAVWGVANSFAARRR